MDLETENRIAAILMKEAAELRRQAARDGIDAYLRPPNVRGRPNSRFLTATVLGVQQSNRAVEVNEMWRARQKEKELDDRAKKEERRCTSIDAGVGARFADYERKRSSSCSSSKSKRESDDGLRDNEIEEFLHSRAKRGRGAVGSRMDETGPYLADGKGKQEDGDNRIVLGPEKPRNLKPYSSSDEEFSCEEREKSNCKHHNHSRKHRSEDKKKKKKKKRDKKRSEHYK